MTNNKDAERLAQLEKELAELKAKVDPPKSTFAPMSDAEWIDQMHQMRERRMNLASNFHPDDLRAMEAACPTSAVKDIVAHGSRASEFGAFQSAAVGNAWLRRATATDKSPRDKLGGCNRYRR